MRRRVALMSMTELPEGVLVRCEIAGRRIGLLRRGQDVRAFSERCTHEEASLCEGFLEGWVVECPRHGATFDLRSGRALAAPATRGLTMYPVEIVEDRIVLCLDEEPR